MLAVVGDVWKFRAGEFHKTLHNDRLFCVRILAEARQTVIQETKDAFVIVKHKCPVENFTLGVRDTDSLRCGFRASDFSIESSFLIITRVIDQSRLKRHGYEVGIDPANHLWLGEDCLTGSAGKHSAASVICRPINENPK